MQSRHRHRQIAAARKVLALIDTLLAEAAQAACTAPGWIEAREALVYGIEINEQEIALASGLYDYHAEQCVIGALLLDNSRWQEVAALISPEDFLLDAHRRIYAHIGAVLARNEVADVATVWDSITASNEGDQVGGLRTLGELALAVPSAANVGAYARIVRRKADERRRSVAG